MKTLFDIFAILVGAAIGLVVTWLVIKIIIITVPILAGAVVLLVGGIVVIMLIILAFYAILD